MNYEQQDSPYSDRALDNVPDHLDLDDLAELAPCAERHWCAPQDRVCPLAESCFCYSPAS